MPIRLNLSRAHAETLSISGSFVLPESAFKTISSSIESAGQLSDMPWLFSESYSVNRQRHWLRASVEPRLNGRVRLQLEFSKKELGVYGDEPKISELFDILVGHGISMNHHCLASFQYKEDAGKSTIIIPMGALKSGARVEVRGIRFTSLDEEDNELYSIVVDHSPGEPYFHSVLFHTTGVVSQETLDEILERAQSISRIYFEVEPRRTASRRREGH